MRYCCRCDKHVDDRNVTEGTTAGYYDVRDGGWFCSPNEDFICDQCMWKDPRYIAVYGIRQ